MKKSITNWVLTKVLPDRIKRLVFLSSLAAYVRDFDQPDDDTLYKLNEILSLSTNADALKLPMYIHTRIWGSFDVSRLKSCGLELKTMKNIRLDQMEQSQMRVVANRLIDYAPSWLRYQTKEYTRQDIYHLFLGLYVVLGNPSKTVA